MPDTARSARGLCEPLRGATRYLDALPGGIVGFTAHGRIVYANLVAGRLFGMPEARLVGQSFADLGLVRVGTNRPLKFFRKWLEARCSSAPGKVIQYLHSKTGHGGRRLLAVRVSRVRGRGAITCLAHFWTPSQTVTAQEELSVILQYAADPIVAVDNAGRVMFCNRAAENIFGYGLEEIVGKPFSRLLNCQRAGRRIADRIWKLPELAQGSHVPDEPFVLKCRTRTGIVFPAECAVSHTWRAGTRIHTIILHDISERLSQLEDMRRQVGLDQIALENIDEGMAVFNAEDRLIAFNRRHRELFGYAENEVYVGMKWTDLVRMFSRLGVYGPGSEEDHLAQRQHMRQKKTFFESGLELSNGRVVEGRRRYLPGGGYVATFRDVTESRKILADYRAAREVVERQSAIQTAILDALPSEVALIDRDGVIIAVNAAWKSFGVKNGLADRNYAVGRNYLAIAEAAEGAGKAYGAEAATGIRKVLDGAEDHFLLEYPCHGPGFERWFQMRVSPVTALGGRGGAVIMHLNVNEQILAERKLQASEARFRAIVDSSGDSILTLDADGRIVTANPISLACLRMAAAELKGRDIRELFPELPFFAPGVDGAAKPVPRIYRAEMAGLRGDGEKFLAEIVMSTVRDVDGDFYTVDFRDRTEHRAMEEQLAQTSKLANLGEMAAGMAHEMNQPLSVMRMAADNALMRMESGRADQDYLKEALELVSDQAGKLGSTILSLKVFARREQDATEQYFDPVNAVRAACQLLQGQMKVQSIDIDLDVPDAVGLVRGGATHLEQVIINLLTNARDAILERRESEADTAYRGKIAANIRRIAVNVHRNPDSPSVLITLEDNGGGIPQSVLPRIFEPFFTTKAVDKGTGLGLSISYGIISSMKGTLSAANTKTGARFEIYLPIAEESAGHIPVANALAAIRSHTEKEGKNASGK